MPGCELILRSVAITLLLALLGSPLSATAQQRVFQTIPATWYVDNVTGSDASACSIGAPCRTIQHVIDYLVDTFDFGAQPTIQLVTTGVSYNEAIILPRYVGSLGWRGPGNYTYPKIQGDPANNAAVVIHPSSGWAVTGVNSSPWIIDSLTIRSTTGGGINSDAFSHILGRNLAFGQVGTGANACQILAQHGGFYEHIAGAFRISGGGWCHAYAHLGGTIKLQNAASVTIDNAPYFSWFALADANGVLDYSGISYTGCLQGCTYRPVQQTMGGWMFPQPASAPPWP